MSFLYPFFLIAGLALAIPVLIHLFNLRRYKTVLFPHVRFLKNIQLHSRRQSQVRYKLLLTLRLLFLAALILAFAQPFFNRKAKTDTANRLQVIYIDNSYSMSVKKGALTLLDIAKDAAIKQLKHAPAGSRFILLSNDKPLGYQPLPPEKIMAEINGLSISPAGRSVNQLLSTVQSLVQSETAAAADLYYYSDFQRTAFTAAPDKSLMQHVNFYGVPVQTDALQNIYIDTAYLSSPVLQTGQSNQLIVHTRAIGKLPAEAPVLQLSINGQVKNAATLSFNDKNEHTDTLSFQVNDAGWQHIMLTVNDAMVRFDDTFRITARSAPNLSVLALNEGQANPYIQAAFRAYNGFRLNQVAINAAPADWKEYNLVILNGVTHIDAALGKSINNAMLQGLSVCIFPGQTANLAALNEGLKATGDITISGLDTAAQNVSSLQQGSDLVKDLFEKIPENVQLPQANWHYIINSGLSANEQSIMSFRNGDPFIARFRPAKGQLYICATAADIAAGNFPASYFFVPFLYQMAVQSRSGDVFAVDIGRQRPVYLSLSNADERNMVHLYGPGLDIIPPQRPNGAGLDVYADEVVQQPGFYKLTAHTGDTSDIAMNANRSESQLETWDLNSLKNDWKGDNIKWINIASVSNANGSSNGPGFPLWKVCVILALLMLAAETYVLAGSFRKQNVATQ